MLYELWKFRRSSEVQSAPPRLPTGPLLFQQLFQESAKGAGGKGARVINCHKFFFTPDRETRRIDTTTTEGTAERKNATICDPGPLYAGPLSALLIIQVINYRLWPSLNLF